MSVPQEVRILASSENTGIGLYQAAGNYLCIIHQKRVRLEIMRPYPNWTISDVFSSFKILSFPLLHDSIL